MSDKIEAKVTHAFAAAPERVYDALTDPEVAVRWQRDGLAQKALDADLTSFDTDPVVGGSFVFADLRAGAERRQWGAYLELDRPHKIRFTWITDHSEDLDPPVVTVIIEPAPEASGSIVTLYHTMDARSDDERMQAEKGWQAMLEAIDRILSHRA